MLKIENLIQNSEEWKFEINLLAIQKYKNYNNHINIQKVTESQKMAFKLQNCKRCYIFGRAL